MMPRLPLKKVIILKIREIRARKTATCKARRRQETSCLPKKKSEPAVQPFCKFSSKLNYNFFSGGNWNLFFSFPSYYCSVPGRVLLMACCITKEMRQLVFALKGKKNLEILREIYYLLLVTYHNLINIQTK
jgi:hypothetical protein